MPELILIPCLSMNVLRDIFELFVRARIILTNLAENTQQAIELKIWIGSYIIICCFF